jgi:hypothetical protein
MPAPRVPCESPNPRRFVAARRPIRLLMRLDLSASEKVLFTATDFSHFRD